MSRSVALPAMVGRPPSLWPATASMAPSPRSGVGRTGEVTEMTQTIIKNYMKMPNFKRVAIALTALLLTATSASAKYEPTEDNLQARKEFRDMGFGVFLHWGLYSMLATGEWTMTNKNLNYHEYEKLAKGFYPAEFDAAKWVSAIKASGAKYICFTTRHHEGFSMFKTKYSNYNIVDGTPFKRDILKELADECHRQGIALHLYYSHLDWYREDYPWGRTGAAYQLWQDWCHLV